MYQQLGLMQQIESTATAYDTAIKTAPRELPRAFTEALPVAETRQEDAGIFKSVVMFSVNFHAWGNRRKAATLPKGITISKADASRVSGSIRLIESKAYDQIVDYLNECRAWFIARSAPSFTAGVFFVKISEVPSFEEKIKEIQDRLTDYLIPDLLSDYERAKTDAKWYFFDLSMRAGIPNLYREEFYPSADRLRAAFGVDHAWLAFSVPEGLPAEIRTEEENKLRAKFAEAQEEVLWALREMFASMIDHARERLTPDATGKSKIFRDSLIENFREFFETFSARNITNDAELAALVDKARSFMQTVDPERLRKSTFARDSVKAKLDDIKKDIDGLLIDRPVRALDLDD